MTAYTQESTGALWVVPSQAPSAWKQAEQLSSSPLLYFHPAVQTAAEVNGAANEDQRPPCRLSLVRKRHNVTLMIGGRWQCTLSAHVPCASAILQLKLFHCCSRQLYCLFIFSPAYRRSALAKCCHDTNRMKCCRCRSANSG